MKIKMLLPNRYKLIGWCIALPGFVVMMLYLYFDFAFEALNFNVRNSHIFFSGSSLFNLGSNNFTDEIAGVLLITGLLLVAFSREKMEDERIIKLRLESLLWAVLVNSIFVIIAILITYDVLFLQVMVYNICTPLIIFIARFNYVMYRENKKLKPEDAL